MLLLRCLFFYSLFLALAACGFHLRGQVALPPQLKYMTLQFDEPYSLLAVQFKATIKNTGVMLSNDAPLKLKLFKDDFTQAVTGIGVTNQLTTYALNYSCTYQLFNQQGKPLFEPRKIAVSRSFTANNNQMLGSSNEQTLLQQDMRRDAIMQIINQLNSKIVLKIITQQ